MVNSRRKNDIRLRKRREEEGEDDEGSVAPGAEDDSMSEESAISDGDEDGDGDISETSDLETFSITNGHAKQSPANGHRKLENKGHGRRNPQAGNPSEAIAANDTEAMMKGLQITPAERDDKGIDFEDLAETNDDTAAETQTKQEVAGKPMSFAEQRRREHEEYKKKRDADPAFVPNRGGFFMHDQRNVNGGPSGFRPFGGKIRGKGRAGFAGPIGQSR